MEACFLAVDEDQPLGVYFVDSYAGGVVELDAFFNESLIDMSAEQAKRYADKFREYADTLEELANQGE